MANKNIFKEWGGGGGGGGVGGLPFLLKKTSENDKEMPYSYDQSKQ